MKEELTIQLAYLDWLLQRTLDEAKLLAENLNKAPETLD